MRAISIIILLFGVFTSTSAQKLIPVNGSIIDRMISNEATRLEKKSVLLQLKSLLGAALDPGYKHILVKIVKSGTKYPFSEDIGGPIGERAVERLKESYEKSENKNNVLEYLKICMEFVKNQKVPDHLKWMYLYETLSDMDKSDDDDLKSAAIRGKWKIDEKVLSVLGFVPFVITSTGIPIESTVNWFPDATLTPSKIPYEVSTTEIPETTEEDNFWWLPWDGLGDEDSTTTNNAPTALWSSSTPPFVHTTTFDPTTRFLETTTEQPIDPSIIQLTTETPESTVATTMNPVPLELRNYPKEIKRIYVAWQDTRYEFAIGKLVSIIAHAHKGDKNYLQEYLSLLNDVKEHFFHYLEGISPSNSVLSKNVQAIIYCFEAFYDDPLAASEKLIKLSDAEKDNLLRAQMGPDAHRFFYYISYKDFALPNLRLLHNLVDDDHWELIYDILLNWTRLDHRDQSVVLKMDVARKEECMWLYNKLIDPGSVTEVIKFAVNRGVKTCLQDFPNVLAQ